MAIAKMQKLSLVSLPSLKASLLRCLQDLQNVQVNEVKSLSKGEQEEGSQKLHNKEHATYTELYERAERALVELSRYGQDEKLWTRLTTKRPTYSMEALHRDVDESAAIELIHQVEHLKEQRHQIVEDRTRIEAEQTYVSNWRGLDINPKELYALDYFDVELGSVPNDANETSLRDLQAALKGKEVAIMRAYSNDDEIGLVLVSEKGLDDEVRNILGRHHFSSWPYPYSDRPAEVFNHLEEERKAKIQAEEDVVLQLKCLTKRAKELKLAAEAFYGHAQIALAEELAFENDYLLYLSGWCDEADLADIKAKLEHEIGIENFALIEEETSEQEINDDEVPIKLKNHAINKPFETLVSMYGLPNYREIDPTPFITPFYMIFFAMMLGDFGYAFVIWAITFFARKKMDLTGQAKELVDLAYSVSYPSMIVGLLYGSCFGVPLPFGVISPADDAIILMIISVVLGLIHLMVALSIRTYLEAKRKNWLSLWNDGLGWMVVLIGIIAWIGGMMLKVGALAMFGKVATLIGFGGMIVMPLIFQKNKGVALVNGLYNIYGVSGYIGDVVSYTRLMALGIAGGSIAMAFNMLVGFLPPVARFTIGIFLIIALQGFNLFLSFLSAYVHGMRLIFVEFFGKFYEAGGKAFRPIGTLQKYVRLNNKE